MEQLKIIVDENGMVNVWKDGIKQNNIKSIDFHADNEHIGASKLKIEQDLMRKETKMFDNYFNSISYKLPECKIDIKLDDLKINYNYNDEMIKAINEYFEYDKKINEKVIQDEIIESLNKEIENSCKLNNKSKKKRK